MRKYNKSSIDWVFSQEEAKAFIQIISVRRMSIIEAIVIEHRIGSDEEEVLESYHQMVEYSEKDALEEVLSWMESVNERFGHKPGEKYIYFRFKRWN